MYLDYLRPFNECSYTELYDTWMEQVMEVAKANADFRIAMMSNMASEDTASTDTAKEGIFTKIWNFIKTVFGKIKDFFMTIFRKIRDFISGTSSKLASKKEDISKLNPTVQAEKTGKAVKVLAMAAEGINKDMNDSMAAADKMIQLFTNPANLQKFLEEKLKGNSDPEESGYFIPLNEFAQKIKPRCQGTAVMSYLFTSSDTDHATEIQQKTLEVCKKWCDKCIALSGVMDKASSMMLKAASENKDKPSNLNAIYSVSGYFAKAYRKIMEYSKKLISKYTIGINSNPKGFNDTSASNLSDLVASINKDTYDDFLDRDIA